METYVLQDEKKHPDRRRRGEGRTPSFLLQAQIQRILEQRQYRVHAIRQDSLSGGEPELVDVLDPDHAFMLVMDNFCQIILRL